MLMSYGQCVLSCDASKGTLGLFLGQDWRVSFESVHHVQLEKPQALAARGGAWFRGGGVELHLGVEDDFRPARKGHPGMLVSDLDDIVARLEQAGQDVRWDTEFPGFRRGYARDRFGNRLEFLQPDPA
jgi:hypothetical protein